MILLTRVKIAFILFLLATANASGAERTVDLGLTPSPVYGLWSNINKAVIVYARGRSTNERWLKKLETMEPNKFFNKTPAQVLEQVKLFKIKLNKINTDSAANTIETLLDSKLPNLLSTDESHVTPSQVYLHSGQILVDVVDRILHLPTVKIEISPFFVEHHFTGKTPSDVFGLVDLGLQRLDEIATRHKSNQLIRKEGA